MEEYDKRFTTKICLLGPQAVGKTAVVRRHVQDYFDDRYLETIGTKITKKVIALRRAELDYKLTNMIWDINGRWLSAGYKDPLMEAFMMASKGALVIYDSTDTTTFKRLDKILEKFRHINGERPLVFMANKVDADANEEFVERLISEVASEWDSPYYFTSAKTGKNIEQAFQKLNNAILDQQVHA